MKRSDQDKLLTSIFEGNPSRLRSRALSAALEEARARKQRRRVTWTVPLLVSLAAALWFVSVTPNQPAKDQAPPDAHAEVRVAPPSAESPPEARTRIRMLTDEELLELFAHRGVALVSEPGGRQRLIVGGDEEPHPRQEW